MKGPHIQKVFGPIYESIVEAFGANYGEMQIFLKDQDGTIHVKVSIPACRTAEAFKRRMKEWNLTLPFMVFPFDRVLSVAELSDWILQDRAISSHPNCMFMVTVEEQKAVGDA